jgi:hypothetical protein
MTGFGQFGPIEMGGMFTLMKVREGQGANDYGDPGPYRNPEGTVAHEVESPAGQPVHRSENPSPPGRSAPSGAPAAKTTSKSHHRSN